LILSFAPKAVEGMMVGAIIAAEPATAVFFINVSSCFVHFIWFLLYKNLFDSPFDWAHILHTIWCC
jgi:hypothetical protein